MTRGKHAATAAKARAERADEQLSVAQAEARRWKQEAERNKTDAQRARSLDRAVERLRREVGVPVDEHEARVASVEERWQQQWDEMMEAVQIIITDLARSIDLDSSWITPRLMMALQVLPSDVVDAALAEAKIERPLRRHLLDSGLANKTKHNMGELLRPLVMRSKARGDGGMTTVEEAADFRELIRRTENLKAYQSFSSPPTPVKGMSE